MKNKLIADKTFNEQTKCFYCDYWHSENEFEQKGNCIARDEITMRNDYCSKFKKAIVPF